MDVAAEVRELLESGQEAAEHGRDAVRAHHPVLAREWFQAASAAFEAAYELDVDDDD